MSDRYRRFIEAMPPVIIDKLDDKMAQDKATRAHYREAAQQAAMVTVPSKWYATDGSNAFYYFRRRALQFSNYTRAFRREPTTCWGTGAEEVFERHHGQLTDRRPRGWVSRTTLAVANYGGYDGSPKQWAPHPDEDVDYDPVMAEKIFRARGAPNIRGDISDFV